MLELATEGEDNEDDDNTDNSTLVPPFVMSTNNVVCFDCCMRVFVCVTPAAYSPIRPLLFLLTASLPCFSYCCACSVIDSLARKAPPRIMWPLVKDFIASKVPRHTHTTKYSPRFTHTTIPRRLLLPTCSTVAVRLQSCDQPQRV